MTESETQTTESSAPAEVTPVESSKPESLGAERSSDDVLKAINEVLDAEVRPGLMQDGGSVDVVRLEEGILEVAYLGACVGCGMAGGGTLQYIKSIIMQRVPEVQDVVAAGPSSGMDAVTL